MKTIQLAAALPLVLIATLAAGQSQQKGLPAPQGPKVPSTVSPVPGAAKIRYTLEVVRPAGAFLLQVYPGPAAAGTAALMCSNAPHATCKKEFDAGTVLTAQAPSANYFRGWGNVCPGTSPTCTFTMNKNITIDTSQGPTPVAAPVWPREMMKTGDTMAVGQYLLSNNKAFYAIQQADGNLCVFKGSGPSDSKGAVWCHQQATPSAPPPYVTVMQTDGNLCTYRGTSTQYISLNWCTHKVAPGGKYFAVLENGGNLCVYKGTGWSDNQGNLWCSTVSASVVPSSGPPVAPPPRADIFTPPRDRPVPRLPAVDADEILMVNDTPHHVWVTLYQMSAPGITPTRAAVCVKPWMFTHLKGHFITRVTHDIRAEATSTENCAPLPNNRHVLCDVRSQVATENSPTLKYSKTTLKANAQKCWWENYSVRY